MYRVSKTVVQSLFVIILFIGAVILATQIEDNAHVQMLIQSFGILGILFVAFLSGVNFIVPIPATAFIPIFSAAGFSLPIIIGTIVFGVTIADLLSYLLGTFVQNHKSIRKNNMYRKIQEWCVGRPRTTQLIVFMYAALFPLPNELLLFPLGTLGVKLRTIFLAFVLGTVVHISLLAYGLEVLRSTFI